VADAIDDFLRRGSAPRATTAPTADDIDAFLGRAGAAPDASPKAGMPRGLIAQLKDQVAGSITGLPAMVASLDDDSTGLGILRNYARGRDGMERALIARAVGQAKAKAADPEVSGARLWLRGEQETHPIFGDVIPSLGRTAGDIRHPSRLKKASDEGRLVEKIVEDVSNIALVGGPVLKGATSTARVTNAAAGGSRAARFATELATVAEHPILTPTKKAAGAVASKGLARAATGEGKLGNLARLADDSIKTRPARLEIARQLGVEGARARSDLLDPIGRFQKAVDNPLEEQAVIAITRGDAEALAAHIRAVRSSPIGEAGVSEILEAYNDAAAPAGHRLTPEGLMLAVDHLDGAVDPKVAARLDAGRKHLEHALDVADARYEAGFGRSDRDAGDPAQRGNQPLVGVIGQRTAGAERRVAARRGRVTELTAAAEAAARRADEVEGLRAAEMEARAERYRAEAQTKRAEAAIAAGERAAVLRREADATEAFAPDAPTPSDIVQGAVQGERRRLQSRGLSKAERDLAADRTPDTQANPIFRDAAEEAKAMSDEALAAARQGVRDVEARGKATERAGTLRRSASTAERTAPMSRAIANADLKASLAAKRAERIRTGKSTIVADDGLLSVARRESEQATAALTREARRLETSVRNLEKLRERARLSPAAAPAKLRPAIVGSRRVATALSSLADEADKAAHGSGQVIRDSINDLATDIDKMAASGMADRVRHVMTGLAREPDGPKLVAPKGMAPKEAKLAAENVRTGTTSPMTAQGLAKLYDKETRKAVGNLVAQKVADTHGVTADALGLSDLRGAKLVEAAAEKGYTPYQLTAGATFNPATAGAKTMFLPSSLAREFRGWSTTRWRWDEILSNTYDPVMGIFRTAVLPLSPRWHAGNLAGNALLATVSAGMNPVDLIRYGREAKRLLEDGAYTGRAATGEAMAVRGGGLTNEAADVLRPVKSERRPGKVRQAGRTLVERSYDLNRTVDDMTRTAVYLRDLDRLGDPTKAMQSALRAMGDFGSMTVTQRAVLRRIFPFVAWSKAITKVTFNLPLDHPYRVSWTLHLGGNLGGGAEQQAALPDWAKGSLPLGADKLLRLSFLNPFGDATEPYVTPKGAARSASPLIKLVAEAGLNRRLDGVKPLTAPRGTDEGIRPIGAKAAGSKALGILPQTRAARDLPGDKVVRYGNTDPVLRNGRTIDASAPGGRLATLAQAAGVPWPTRSQTEQAKARAAKAEAADRKAKATYDRRRRAAAKKKPVKA
jgi:hypothetical protein